METIEEMYPIFQQLISLATKTPLDRVVLADQGRTPPVGNDLYATYNPIPVRAYGQTRRKREFIPVIVETDPALGNDWQDLRETACTSMVFLLSVNFLNAGAATAAMHLANANFVTPVSDYLFHNKIAWRFVSNRRNLTGLLQAGLQPRYQADIHLFIEKTVSYTLLRAAGFDIQIRERDGTYGLSG
ncbi:LIC_12616 family protein [Yersinia pseudotuberculosis]|uniref:phage neck terminator protein n=1 Tax=Yersinia pseudotuberculosis TaxID=633 RepID=UPI0005E0EA0C|nr:hypothetical protein [Yersinia pseudotuberculosis]CND24377.1 Uncharacterised protein [Yersinia pseudotuberculosis]